MYGDERPAKDPTIGRMGSGVSRSPRLDDDRAQALKAVELPLDQLNRSIDEARTRIIEQAKNVRTLADHLFGPEPEQGGPSPTAPPRNGRLGNLHDAAEYLHNNIGELNHQIDRFAPLAG